MLLKNYIVLKIILFCLFNRFNAGRNMASLWGMERRSSRELIKSKGQVHVGGENQKQAFIRPLKLEN